MKIKKFSATWCAPCKMLSKMLTGVNNVEIESIDIDDNFELATQYGVRGVPTMVMIDEQNNEIKRMVGLPKTDTALKEWLTVV